MSFPNEWGKPFVLKPSLVSPFEIKLSRICFSTSGCKVIMNVFQRAAVFCINAGPKLPGRVIAPTLARGTSGVVSRTVYSSYSGRTKAFLAPHRHISSNNIGMTAPVETRYPVSTLEAGEMSAPNVVKQSLISTATLISTLVITLGAPARHILHYSCSSFGLGGVYGWGCDRTFHIDTCHPSA